MSIFRDIKHYSKERKIALIKAIEKINWDTNYTPKSLKKSSAFIHLSELSDNRLLAIFRS